MTKQQKRILVLLYLNFIIWTAVWMADAVSYGVYSVATVVPALVVLWHGMWLYINENMALIHNKRS